MYAAATHPPTARRSSRTAMRNNTLFVVVFFTMVSLSCKDSTSPAGSPVNAGAIIPLAVGNQWVMRSYSWDSTGTPNVTEIDTTRIERDTLLLSERWFIGRTGIPVTNRSTGYWIFIDSMPQLFLKYPTSLNESYLYREDTVRVTALDTAITVPGGTFSCICYTMTYRIADYVSQILLVSPNSGIIRREIIAHTSGGSEYLARREELISFQR